MRPLGQKYWLQVALGAFCVLCPGLTVSTRADTVTFTITADSFSTTIYAITAGQAPVNDVFTVGINVHITQYNGQPKILNLLEFCHEMAEPITPGPTYVHDVVPAREIGVYSAGDPGSEGYGIPAGGIGDLRAARLSYLMDTHYKGTSASDWTRTDAEPDTIAFQLAVWETTHDTDLSLAFNPGAPAGTSMWIDAANINNSSVARRANAITLAQSYLDDVAAASVPSTYTSINWDVLGLIDDGDQDLAIATAKGALVPVPEPASLLIVSTGLALLLGRRRRSAKC